MSKSFVLTDRITPELSFTLGVDERFLDILEIFLVDVSELSQEELDLFLGTLSIHKPEITVRTALPCSYVLRYE